MGRRKKRDNSSDIVKLIFGLILFGSFAISGGDVTKAMGLFMSLLISIITLGIFGLVLYFILRTTGSLSSSSNFTESSTFPSSSRSESSSRYDPVEHFVNEGFTRELLDQLEWRRFEILVQLLFQAEGKLASRLRAGADGGIDLALRDSPYSEVTAIVQCKAWKTYSVGVKPVRELYGVMHSEGVSHAYFFSSGHYTSEAKSFVIGKPMDLVDGDSLLDRLNALEESERNSILEEVTAGDYTTPSCPSCDIKMVLRSGKYGNFWGCPSYPRCKQKFRIKK